MLTVAFRNLRRNKLISILNIAGLSVGLAAFLILAQYIHWENSYDGFHKKSERLARVSFQYYKQGALNFHTAATFAGVGPRMTEEFPQVLNSCRIVPILDGAIVEFEDKVFEEPHMLYVDPSFFELFSFPVTRGTASGLLVETNTTVIAEHAVQKYFGSSDPVGRQITVKSRDGEETLLIVGVAESPRNSHIRFDFLLSYRTLINRLGPVVDNGWNWFDYVTYVEFNSSDDLDDVQALLPDFIDKYGSERLGSDRVKFVLQPFPSIHLHSNLLQELTQNGDINTVRFLTIVSIFILFIAWINYVNLTTASSTKRFKEVGIRKTLGSSKLELRKQFYVESGLVNIGSLGLGLAMFAALLPYFSEMTGTQVVNTFFSDVRFWIVISLVCGFGSLISGYYPALVLSSIQPKTALQGAARIPGNAMFRKGLVIFQFAISSALISGTLIVYHQMSFMLDKAPGIDTEHMITIRTPNFEGQQERFNRRLGALKSTLQEHSLVRTVSASSVIPGLQVGWFGGAQRISQRQSGDRNIIYKMTVDTDYLDSYANKFLAGSNFRRQADSAYAIINLTAVRSLGYETPEKAINERIALAGMDTLRILGVIDDFHQEALRENFRPTVYLLLKEELSYLSVKVKSSDADDFLGYAAQAFEAQFPGIPFEYHVLNDFMAHQYEAEQRFLTIFISFSFLAILIALLGLVGLSYFSTQNRKKEIGIRKVLGSGSSAIFGLLTRDILISVFWSNLLIAPLTFYLGNTWLNDFAFNGGFSWASLTISLCVTVFFAVLTTAYLICKAAISNPIEALRHE